MKTERGEIALAFIILMVVIALVFVGLLATCDALWDDEDEPDDLGQPALVLDRQAPTEAAQRWTSHGDQRGDDRSDGRNSDGKCKNAENCQDNDGINADKVILCLPQSTCNFGKGEQASLLPPDPAKLVASITAMTKAVGDAAGALAGAIAGGTIGILLQT